jgi:peptidoglycan/LPS O-acetylase OafA/YrhL
MKVIDRFHSKHEKRIVGLDILRTLAILLVVYVHGRLLLPEDMQVGYMRGRIFKISGVAVFFVLSGFLIGNILIRLIRNTDFLLKDLINFWIRRWFRTLPNYFLMLFVLIILTAVIDWPWYGFSYKYFFFIQNLSGPHPNFFPVAWSLSVEEWFYLLFPVVSFIFLKLSRKKNASILAAVLLFLIVPFLLRVAKFENWQILGEWLEEAQYRKTLLLRLDSLMFGFLGAFLFSTFPKFWKKVRYYLLAVGLVLLVSYVRVRLMKYTYFPLLYNLDSITILCLLPFLSQLKTTRLKWLDSSFIFISVISYSMYLVHLTWVRQFTLPLISITLGYENAPKEEIYGTNLILYWGLTIVFSYLLYRFFEQPVTELRERFSRKEAVNKQQ